MAIFCLLCGKRFQTQTALQQHMEVHAGVRSYICSECNRTFPSHTALKRHLRSHTGKREQLANRLHYTVVRSLTIQMEALVCCRAAIKTITGKCIFAWVWGKENNWNYLVSINYLKPFSRESKQKILCGWTTLDDTWCNVTLPYYSGSIEITFNMMGWRNVEKIGLRWLWREW